MSSSEIMLDLDDYSRNRLLRLIRSRWWFLLVFDWPIFGKLKIQNAIVRRTNHGYHVLIRVKNKIPNRELAFLQLALGSDVCRESMNLRRISSIKQMSVWNVLFAFKFNNRGDVTSRERPDIRLSRKITKLVKELAKTERTRR